jgi:hypothetical protein
VSRATIAAFATTIFTLAATLLLQKSEQTGT